MENKIIEFSNLLRKVGIKLSPSEVIDSLNALVLTEMDKNTFYNTLVSTLIKNHSDERVFNKLFDYYFDSDFFCHQDTSLTKSCSGSDPVCDADTDTERSRPTGFGKGQGSTTKAVDDFIQVIKTGTIDNMERLIKKGIDNLGKFNQDDLNDLKEVVRQVKVALEWNMGTYELEKLAGAEDEGVWLVWQERIKIMEEMLYRQVEKALIDEFGQEALNTILIRENLNDLDFYQLSVHQVDEIKKKISKLAHKLAARLSYRYKRAKHGKIDLQRTIRRSVATGGTPLKPAFKDRYPNKPEFVVLCDVSGSVKVFSEFMLQLVFSIQSRFFNVRSFAFIDTPDEVTEYFKFKEAEDAIKEMYNKAKFSKTAFSNYGEVFIDFHNKYLDTINKKTTLLVIGDARNNYYKDHADYFEKLADEAKKVIWLNPELLGRWNTEDSIMSVYARYCHQVFECRNLAQLEYIAKKII